tara:strand:- start:1844 stop:2416 length:573 start_codon:yes stop_codon:yes gene_type:complete
MKLYKDFKIKGLIEFKPTVHEDSRGQFIETFNEELLRDHGFDYHFKQDNQSISAAGVFRGIHLQSGPYAQGKLVRVAMGTAVDYAVDLRPGSDTFGQWESVILHADEGNQFWIPPGFGHAFMALENNTIFCYKCTELYAPNNQVCIRWDDPDINLSISKLIRPIVSKKDEDGMYLTEYTSITNNKGGSFI